MDNSMDDNIAIWTITWMRKNRGRWSEEILFIFPENFTHPSAQVLYNIQRSALC